MIKFKVFRSKKNKQFYFHILSRNGRKIAQSEGYKRLAGVQNAIQTISTYSPKADLEQWVDANGDWVLV